MGKSNWDQKIAVVAKDVAGTMLLLLFIAGFSGNLFAQNYKKAQWSRAKMDSTWNCSTGKAAQVIDKYRPSVDSLLLPIGSTEEELTSYPPEDKLSNFAADVMLDFGNKWLAENVGGGVKADMSITNFGGIRASMPCGTVTSFDIISIFPFDNKVMILDLEGKYVRMLMENFAKRARVEAMGGVRLKIDHNQLVECTVAGEPIDDSRIYKVVTIDFLLGGGDSVFALKYASKAEDTGLFMRDVVIDHIKDLTAQGKKVEAQKDGRAVVIKEKKR